MKERVCALTQLCPGGWAALRPRVPPRDPHLQPGRDIKASLESPEPRSATACSSGAKHSNSDTSLVASEFVMSAPTDAETTKVAPGAVTKG